MNCCSNHNNRSEHDKGLESEEKKVSWKVVLAAIVMLGLLVLSLINLGSH